MAEPNKEKTSDCIFCKIVAGEIKAEKLADEENFIVIDDAFPVVEGHCLIISKKHYESLLDMPASLGGEVASIVKKQALRLIREKGAEGFNFHQNNFKAAGQVVPHLHFHVIPRKKDDGIDLSRENVVKRK